jgi:hypothetical protein
MYAGYRDFSIGAIGHYIKPREAVLYYPGWNGRMVTEHHSREDSHSNGAKKVNAEQVSALAPYGYRHEDVKVLED